MRVRKQKIKMHGDIGEQIFKYRLLLAVKLHFGQLKRVRHTKVTILKAKNKTANNLSGRILIPAVHRM